MRMWVSSAFEPGLFISLKQANIKNLLLISAGCIVLKDLLVSSSNLDEKNQYIASLKVKVSICNYYVNTA